MRALFVVSFVLSAAGCATPPPAALFAAGSGDVVLVAAQTGFAVRARAFGEGGGPQGESFALFDDGTLRALVARPVGGWIAVAETNDAGDLRARWLAPDGHVEHDVAISASAIAGISGEGAYVLGDRLVLGPGLGAPGVVAIDADGAVDRSSDVGMAGRFVSEGDGGFLVRAASTDLAVQPVDAWGVPSGALRTYDIRDYVLPPVVTYEYASAARGDDVAVVIARRRPAIGGGTMSLVLHADGSFSVGASLEASTAATVFATDTGFITWTLTSGNVHFDATGSGPASVTAPPTLAARLGAVASTGHGAIAAWVRDDASGSPPVLVADVLRSSSGEALVPSSSGLAITR